MKIFFSLFVVLSACMPILSAQEINMHWWNLKHNWDGHSPWFSYMTMSPGHMGPNALPIPEVQSGELFGDAYAEMEFRSHISAGDHTQSIKTRFYFPILKDKVAIDFYGIPFERFQTDTITRDLRAARDWDGKGYSIGDLYFGTIIQIVKNKKFPDLALAMYCKTASGNNLENARFTDAPGYFFNGSIGKNILKKQDFFIRLYAMGGFYAWQTHDDVYLQNDAILFGGGADLNLKKWAFQIQTGGYLGYIGRKDDPVTLRLKVKRQEEFFHYSLSWQYDLHDINFQTIKLAIGYNFLKK